MNVRPDLIEELFRQHVTKADRNAAEDGEQRLSQARASVKANDRDPQCYIAAARCCKQLGHLHETLEILKNGIEHCAPSAPLFEYYIERLEKCNRTEQAIALARQVAELFPNELIFRLRAALILPVLYDSQAQLEDYQRRFSEGLNRIIAEVPLETPVERQLALDALGRHVIKYLGYQGCNDRSLREQYGEWVHKIMSAAYPRFSERPPMPPPDSNGRLRIGYVSARFHDTSVAKAFLGWLQEHDRTLVTPFAYYASPRSDAVTGQVRDAVESFTELRNTIEDDASTIRNDRLHVLVFLDVGMDAFMTQLAALRLAPVQCAAWDYPVTTGLPTMDYFLSGDAMEPHDAADHYSEELVRLPGLGVHYTKPVIPTALLYKRREDFGIRDDAVVYLLSQTIFKYLPVGDRLLAQIAKRVPNSQFVFLVTNEIVNKDLERRLGRAFAEEGLDASSHCLLLPEMAKLNYWNLHRISDVILDSIGWSGGVSTFDAVALGIPVVTLPGSFMRGRQSAAILSQLGVTETIARNPDDYVDLAVRLGLDHEWRKRIVQKMKRGHSAVYSDTVCVRALEAFFARAVQNYVD